MTHLGNVRGRLRKLEQRQQEWQMRPEAMQDRAKQRSQERWLAAAERLLRAVAPEQRDAVVGVLKKWAEDSGSGIKPWPGLASWVYHLEHERGFLPDRIPPEVIATYLTDARSQPEA